MASLSQPIANNINKLLKSAANSVKDLVHTSDFTESMEKKAFINISKLKELCNGSKSSSTNAPRKSC